MIILKIINSDVEDIETYNAINSAVYHKKLGNDVIIMGPSSGYVSEFCKKNKIDYRRINLFYRSGLFSIPNTDIIEIYGYSNRNDSFIQRVFSIKKPKILRLFQIPDEETISFIKKNLSFFSRIIPITNTIKDFLLSVQIPQFNIVVLNPILVMTRWESAKQIKPMTFMKRPYRIAYVSKKERYDDAKFFLQIAHEVLKTNDNVNFMIVGPKNDKIREFARELGISHKIDILGWRGDMPEVMAMTHIYVSTKREMDYCRSIIEAMASSVVCVGPKLAFFSDFIQNDYTGITVEDRNLSEYVNAIKNLLSDPVNTQNISAMAYAYAKANFSAEVIVSVEDLIYEEVTTEYLSRMI